jgi:hypothetical protein
MMDRIVPAQRSDLFSGKRSATTIDGRFSSLKIQMKREPAHSRFRLRGVRYDKLVDAVFGQAYTF